MTSAPSLSIPALNQPIPFPDSLTYQLSFDPSIHEGKY